MQAFNNLDIFYKYPNISCFIIRLLDRIGDRLSDRIGYRELLKMDDRIGNRIGDFFMIGTTLVITPIS